MRGRNNEWGNSNPSEVPGEEDGDRLEKNFAAPVRRSVVDRSLDGIGHREGSFQRPAFPLEEISGDV